MARKTPLPRLYGTADPGNPRPVAEGGLRGERSAEQSDPAAGLQHTQMVDGHEVTVEETSGTAYAEKQAGVGPDEN